METHYFFLAWITAPIIEKEIKMKTLKWSIYYIWKCRKLWIKQWVIWFKMVKANKLEDNDLFWEATEEYCEFINEKERLLRI